MFVKSVFPILLRLPLVLLLLGPALASNHAHAFEFSGHAQVCEMAYQLATPETRQWIDQQVKAGGEKSFAHACSWADEVRDERKFRHTKPWHYINVPRTATSVRADDCGDKGCVVQAINDMQQRLSKNKDDWQALFFLAHFMADVHQPMHVSFADDRGGNKAAVRFNGDKTNLHQLWDGDLLGKFSYKKQSALALTQISAQERHDWSAARPLDVANESFTITREIYRHYQQAAQTPVVIDDAYIRQFRPQLQQRLQQAAVRLAEALNGVSLSGHNSALSTKPPMDN